jgi:hypothetical protein
VHTRVSLPGKHTRPNAAGVDQLKEANPVAAARNDGPRPRGDRDYVGQTWSTQSFTILLFLVKSGSSK